VPAATAHGRDAPLQSKGRVPVTRPAQSRRDPSDESLFAAHVAGENGAFESLFARHASRIYRIMRQRGLSHADSQDLVPQTFLAAHQARRDFRAGSPRLPWLWTIAYNLLRRAHRRHDLDTQAERVGSGAPSPMVAAYAIPPDEARRGVRQAIARLSPSQREVIVLHWYEGLTFQEIGRVLCASESAVKVRAHRGYERLREILHEPVDTERAE
jgi:RNA polymerase sigma-70 factor (ECF subfamily)